MLQRVEAMESELGALVESLRTGANRLQADLTLLEGNLGEMSGAVGSAPRPRAVAAAPAEAPPASPAEPEVELEELEVVEVLEVVEPELEPEIEPEPAAAGLPESDTEDVEGARLIALNMALNGTAREETDRYLAANFDLSDREALLDEVYASVEG
jgi:hypothetical protein